MPCSAGPTRKAHHATEGLDETKLAFHDPADKEYPFPKHVSTSTEPWRR